MNDHNFDLLTAASSITASGAAIVMLSNHANGERKIIGCLGAVKANRVRLSVAENISHVDLITMAKLAAVERKKLNRRPLIRTLVFDSDLDLTCLLRSRFVLYLPVPVDLFKQII